MTQDDALHRFRLRALGLAEEMGNVRAACKAMGIHPSTYYRWRHQLGELRVAGFLTEAEFEGRSRNYSAAFSFGTVRVGALLRCSLRSIHRTVAPDDAHALE